MNQPYYNVGTVILQLKFNGLLTSKEGQHIKPMIPSTTGSPRTADEINLSVGDKIPTAEFETGKTECTLPFVGPGSVQRASKRSYHWMLLVGPIHDALQGTRKVL